VIDVEERGQRTHRHWRAGDNRLNPESVAEWHALLDELTRARDRSPGADRRGQVLLKRLRPQALRGRPEDRAPVVASSTRLFGRLLTFPAYTSPPSTATPSPPEAMLASSCDVRVMRQGRGYWCLPEVDLGLPIPFDLFTLLGAHVPKPALLDAMVTARRYSADEALALGIVERAVPEDRCSTKQWQLAEAMAEKNRKIIAMHKELIFGETARICGALTPALPRDGGEKTPSGTQARAALHVTASCGVRGLNRFDTPHSSRRGRAPCLRARGLSAARVPAMARAFSVMET